MKEILAGYCHCGCGEKTRLAPQKIKAAGLLKGQPLRFVRGHNSHGESHWAWKGGKTLHDGYPMVRIPGHSRANPTNNYVLEHVTIAEKALGRSLKHPECVHHHGPKKDQCLVICQNDAYHQLLHIRTRALKECGHADWLKCHYCKKYDAPENLYLSPRRQAQGWHNQCHTAYQKSRKQ